MSVTLLKFVHIATIALWSAGLICLPFLFRQRAGLEGDRLHRLHGLVRYLYVMILSPAAFVAIASGTVLIFLQRTFEVWFALKLLLVGMLVVAHILAGRVILKLFEDNGRYGAWHYLLAIVLTSTLVTLILVVVSLKPGWEIPTFEGDPFAPGWLGERFGTAYLRESIMRPTP